jgi:NADPH:quinone reductase-like Zn-dependent oxidoreductase
VVDREVGQRVVATLSSGSHAEVVAALASTTWVIPEGADVVAAACVPVACSNGIPLAAGWASVDPPTLWPGHGRAGAVSAQTRRQRRRSSGGRAGMSAGSEVVVSDPPGRMRVL